LSSFVVLTAVVAIAKIAAELAITGMAAAVKNNKAMTVCCDCAVLAHTSIAETWMKCIRFGVIKTFEPQGSSHWCRAPEFESTITPRDTSAGMREKSGCGPRGEGKETKRKKN